MRLGWVDCRSRHCLDQQGRARLPQLATWLAKGRNPGIGLGGEVRLRGPGRPSAPRFRRGERAAWKRLAHGAHGDVCTGERASSSLRNPAVEQAPAFVLPGYRDVSGMRLILPRVVDIADQQT